VSSATETVSARRSITHRSQDLRPPIYTGFRTTRSTLRARWPANRCKTHVSTCWDIHRQRDCATSACVRVGGVEKRCGGAIPVSCVPDAASHSIRQSWKHWSEVIKTRREAFVSRRNECFPSNPVHPEHKVKVLSVIAVGMNRWAGHVYPSQTFRGRADAGLLKYFSHSTVRRVLAGFDNAGDRRPGTIIRASDEKHLITADDHSGDTGQPQRRMTNMPTKLNDEIGNWHTQFLTGAENFFTAFPCR
jgi:hypothetical protein